MARLPSLETLRIFAVAARHLSFTRAADELHLTQPSPTRTGPSQYLSTLVTMRFSGSLTKSLYHVTV